MKQIMSDKELKKENIDAQPQNVEAQDLSEQPQDLPSEQTETVSEQVVEDLKQQVQELSQKNDDLFARLQRLAADFENYKKRARQEQLEIMEYGNLKLIERLLPVLDSFEKALENKPDGIDEMWLKGLEMVLGQLKDVLAAFGVEPIEAVGKDFDPHLHEAVMHDSESDFEEGKVTEELQKGYTYHGRVIRPALVKLAGPK